jgi:hypothetical protein
MKTIITPRFAVMLAVAIAMTAMFVGCSGIDIGDYVKVDTPVDIQQSYGLPARLTLNRSEVAYESWFNVTAINGTAWKSNIESGRETAQLFRSLSLQAASELLGTEAVAAIPGLTLLIGLFMRKPGDVSGGDASEREKASFNKGQKVMLEALEKQAARTPGSDARAAEIIEAVKAIAGKGNA